MGSRKDIMANRTPGLSGSRASPPLAIVRAADFAGLSSLLSGPSRKYV